MIVTDPQRYLPQQPPILMLDQVIDLEPGLRGTGVKHFRADDPYFHGHFPDKPILPGIYLIESFAQTALVVMASQKPARDDGPAELGYLAKVVEAAFYQLVVPGDLILFEVAIGKRLRQFQCVSCSARLGEKRVARAELTLALPSTTLPG